MAAWIIWWFVIALVTTVAFLACAAALVRHVWLLGRTVRVLQQEAQPIVEEISAGARRASERSSSLRPPAARSRR